LGTENEFLPVKLSRPALVIENLDFSDDGLLSRKLGFLFMVGALKKSANILL